jgi:hypothetical protein
MGKYPNIGGGGFTVMKKVRKVALPLLASLSILLTPAASFANGKSATPEVAGVNVTSNHLSPANDELEMGTGAAKGGEEKEKKYTHLRLPYDLIREPVLIGDDLYMAINENSPSITNTIIKYNLKTKKTTKIFTSQFEDASINTIVGNQDWLVWVDSNAYGTKNKMWAKNLNTGTTQVLSESEDELITLDCPYLYQDYVAWTHVDEKKKSAVHLINLKTNEEKVVHHLHDYSLINAFVQMNNGKLVWSDEMGQVPYYMVYDLNTKQTKSYKAPGYYPGYVQLVGDQIFSINATDHFMDASLAWTGMFDTKTGKSTKLENHFVDGLTGFGNYIVYASNDIKDSKDKLKVFKVKEGTLKRVVVDIHPLHAPDFFRITSDDILLITCPVSKGNEDIVTDLLIVQL